MIIGRGLIASHFNKSIESFENLTIMASGVSNSSEYRETEFRRERNLVLEYSKGESPLIYFSTISIYDQSRYSSAYVQHKIEMESLVRSNCNRYLILRLPNLIGIGGNPNNFFNFIMNKILSGEEVHCHMKARRYFLDASLLPSIVSDLLALDKSITIDVCPHKSYLINDVIHLISRKLGVSANLLEVDKGHSYVVDTEYFDKCINQDLLLKVNRPLEEILQRVLA